MQQKSIHWSENKLFTESVIVFNFYKPYLFETIKLKFIEYLDWIFSDQAFDFCCIWN